MKRIFLMVLLYAFTNVLKAQNTYPFPSNGNVGIGTTNPAAILSVNTSDAPDFSNIPNWVNNGYSIFGPNSSNSNGAALALGYSNTTNSANILSLSPSIEWKPLRFSAKTFSFLSNGSVQGLYQNAAGSVSIGTTDAHAPFDITQDATAGNTSYMQCWNWSEQPYNWGLRLEMYHSGGSIDYHFVQNAGNNNLNVLTFQKGNVGIETTIPTSTFQVEEGVSKVSIGSAGDVGSGALNSGTGYIGLNAARFYNNGTMQSWLVNSDQQHNGGGAIFGDISGDIYLSPINIYRSIGSNLE